MLPQGDFWTIEELIELGFEEVKPGVWRHPEVAGEVWDMDPQIAKCELELERTLKEAGEAVAKASRDFLKRKAEEWLKERSKRAT